MLFYIFLQPPLLTVQMHASQPRQKGTHEEVVVTATMIPTVREYNIPRLITDTLYRGVVDEEGVILLVSIVTKKLLRQEFR